MIITMIPHRENFFCVCSHSIHSRRFFERKKKQFLNYHKKCLVEIYVVNYERGFCIVGFFNYYEFEYILMTYIFVNNCDVRLI